MSDEWLAARARAGDGEARRTLILRHRRLVRRVAHEFRFAGFPDEDLNQAGTVGLILAVDRFRPDRGVLFSTYARTVVRGELQHLLRDHGWAVRVARSVQDLGRAAAHERERLGQRLGRPATVEETARSLERSPEAVAEALRARAAYRPAARAVADEEEAVPAPLRVTEAGFGAAEWRMDLAAALRRLPLRERRILALRFERELNQRAIAAELGISQMHVSRLLRSALASLRELLDEAPA